MSADPIVELDQAMTQGGIALALEKLAERFLAQEQWHELFDLRLMQARERLSLPIVGGNSLDELPPIQRDQLEQGYLAACSEVGEQLIQRGRLREAWMYLRPTGQTAAMSAALAAQVVDEDNVEELIELALQERIAPVLGFRYLLENHGTCNAITVYDSEFPRCSLADQQAAAQLLIEHLHQELLQNVRTDIQRREGRLPVGTRLAELLPEREWLFSENNYHVDTTHLNSAVRIGRVVTAPSHLELLVDLCCYGQGLAKQFQFESDPPFEATYSSSRLFFAAQLGTDIEQAVELFRSRAEAADPLVIGTGPAEVYVVLLQRLQHWLQAIAACVKFLPPGTRTGGFAPNLLELSRVAGDFQQLKQFCRERQDYLNYAAALAVEAETLTAKSL